MRITVELSDEEYREVVSTAGLKKIMGEFQPTVDPLDALALKIIRAGEIVRKLGEQNAK